MKCKNEKCTKFYFTKVKDLIAHQNMCKKCEDCNKFNKCASCGGILGANHQCNLGYNDHPNAQLFNGNNNNQNVNPHTKR